MKLHFNTATRRDNTVRFHFRVDSRRDCRPWNEISIWLRGGITWLCFSSRLISVFFWFCSYIKFLVTYFKNIHFKHLEKLHSAAGENFCTGLRFVRFLVYFWTKYEEYFDHSYLKILCSYIKKRFSTCSYIKVLCSYIKKKHTGTKQAGHLALKDPCPAFPWTKHKNHQNFNFWERFYYYILHTLDGF